MGLVENTLEKILKLFYVVPSCKLLRREKSIEKELKALYNLAFEQGYNKCYHDSLKLEMTNEETNRF